jgi:hypothetical protein
MAFSYFVSFILADNILPTLMLDIVLSQQDISVRLRYTRKTCAYVPVRGEWM